MAEMVLKRQLLLLMMMMMLLLLSWMLQQLPTRPMWRLAPVSTRRSMWPRWVL